MHVSSDDSHFPPRPESRITGQWSWHILHSPGLLVSVLLTSEQEPSQPDSAETGGEKKKTNF